MAQKRKRNKKWIYVMLVVVLVASAGVTCWLLRGTKSDWKEGGQTETTLQREDDIDEEEVERPSEEVAKVDPDTGKEIVVQYDGEDPNQADDLSGVVTYAGVVDGTLMIRVNIDQYLEGGNCELTLIRDGANIYSSIANIVGGPSTATCEGFDVPIGGLEGGQTEININLNADERHGVIRGEVNI